MEQQRVKEILESPEITNVTYQNIPIWIDNMASAEMVTIHDMNSDISMDVPAGELNEVDL